MLSDTIREMRIKNGMSLYRLAKLSGHAVSTIHGIENGENKNPSFITIGNVAHVLGVSLDELYQACFVHE